jgi:LysR family transcriptional regulator, glycine cleavage system transcriptional activator
MFKSPTYILKTAMTDRLRLNISALRALETAERCRSFTLAANELNLTHSAISHQIRQIEGMLSIPLFERAQTQMIPTEACTRLAERVRKNLADLEFALLEARNSNQQQRLVLKVNVMADFANVWLIPKLEAFSDVEPHLDLSITVRNTLDVPERHEADVGIWHRPIDRNGFQSRKLLDDSVVAVCTPAFFAKHAPLDANKLAHIPLLKFAGRSWQEFFDAAGIRAGDPNYGPMFSDAASLLQAALVGQGVAMLRERLIHSYLRDGTLVRIGTTRIPSTLSYHICWHQDNPKREAILQFAEWLAEIVNESD